MAATYTVIYADAEGQSHFEEREVSKSLYREGVPADTVHLSLDTGRHRNTDWHPVTPRQFVITLQGMIEIIAGDGESRRFGPGSVLLIEDTWGKGHIGRTIGDEPWRVAMVHLPDEPTEPA